MRPRCAIESIVIFNSRNGEGAWIPTSVKVNSWVILQPGKQGGHAKDAKKHGATVAEGAYKAKILKFKVENGSNVVSKVLVQHAYMQRQILDLDLAEHQTLGACNYLYLSEFTDWIDPKSILDIIVVHHAEIGEAQRSTRTHRELLKNNIFFYNAKYIPQKSLTSFGSLEMIPLPSFNDPDWPLPDMATSEGFRSKMRIDILSFMKPTVGSKCTHLNWYIPVHVIVDLFASTALYRTPTLFVFKNLTEECFVSLMDDGWDTKVIVGFDIIKCTANRSSMIYRYHIGRSILYFNFVYNRQRLVSSSNWEPLEQIHGNDMVQLQVEVVNRNIGPLLQLEVGSAWTLSSIRQEIVIALGEENGEDFIMFILEAGKVLEKVNIRKEKVKTVVEVMPPRTLRLVF